MRSDDPARREQPAMTVTIGVSGYLINSDVLLWDRETQTLWSQIDARGIAGPRAGYELTHLPIADTTWKAWRAAHPEGRVLRGPKSPTEYRGGYRRYHESDQVLFPVAHSSDRLPKKSVVTGVRVSGDAACWSHASLRERAAKREEALRATPLRFIETVGDRAVRVSYDPVGDSVTVHEKSKDGGFVPLAPLRMYWFAWFAFHPRTSVDGEVPAAPEDEGEGEREDES